MLLDYLQQPIPYDRLRQILGTGEIGTPLPNIHHLQRLGLHTHASIDGTFEIMSELLDLGLPSIADVFTGELPYWQARTDILDYEKNTFHAVVVVGIENEGTEDGVVYINDPDFEEAPIAINYGDFDLAWLEQENRFALIGLDAFENLPTV